MSGIVSGGGFAFEVASVGGIWRWSVNVNNVQGLGQNYEVLNIQTPFGPLNQTLIPIPENVIDCMSDSLATIRQQFAPLMSLVGSTTNFAATFTEGDNAASVGSITVQNVGSFGSFMDVTATSGVSWLTIEPNFANGVGHNKTATFSIIANPTSLLNANSPYTGVITFQDNRTPATVIQASVELTINPRPVIQVSSASFNFNFFTSTNSSSGNQTLTIENAGPVDSTLSVSITAVKGVPWLSFAPTTLSSLASGQSGNIILSIVDSSAPAVKGVYTETIRIISPTAISGTQDITIVLTVL